MGMSGMTKAHEGNDHHCLLGVDLTPEEEGNPLICAVCCRVLV
jgi:hypothetical protein